MVEDNINKQIEQVENIKEVEIIDRNELNIQQFMNDMRMLGEQVNNKDLVKPLFHYGDASVTNYLLWLLLGEAMLLNDKLNEDKE